jgi:hypothetical protein
MKLPNNKYDVNASIFRASGSNVLFSFTLTNFSIPAPMKEPYSHNENF